MKDECTFIGREIADLLEDMEDIKDKLLLAPHRGVSFPYINQGVDNLVKDTKGLVDWDLIKEEHYREVEQAVKDFKLKLPAETKESQSSFTPTGEVMFTLGHIKTVLVDTLMDTVSECECRKK